MKPDFTKSKAYINKFEKDKTISILYILFADREVTFYEHVCTRMCSLVASTPATCFPVVVSTIDKGCD